MDIEFSKEQEIRDTNNHRPHIVLLGAGASRAAFSNGDKNGLKIPLMDELFDLLNITKENDINFEAFFSNLYEKDPNSTEVKNIESKLYNYFSELELPKYPTIYDYLVLSLRPKDVIASFNWDPFLWLAAQRNYEHVPLPHIFFLHGSVAVGYCFKCRMKGYRNSVCSTCGGIFSPSKLLYPVRQKKYTADPSIDGEWKALQHYLKRAYMFTIFGYSAPVTDVEAVALLKNAWGDKYDRSLEEIEFIHKENKDEDSVIRPWKDFIHSHHYRLSDNFFKSWIAKHPRRTCDTLWQELMEAKFVSENPVPVDCTLEELQNWYKELVVYEDEIKKTTTKI